ncbi:c-type cytochrome [Novosphingobium kaempferiae]|uniref:c-type cytochrome n=1 Tax=Novosphingobium kaempferiae TaxID=2896849 RepID=UPI001E4D5382|nr:c-type cytochrome [Novosphingobium kaempferiae]
MCKLFWSKEAYFLPERVAMRFSFDTARIAAAAASFVALGSAAIGAPDAPSGEALFKQRGCTVCHSLTMGKNLNGPSLAGVYGRAMGKAAGYKYSPNLGAAKGKWDAATLDRWLADPRAMVPGTKMAVKVASPQDRAALIAYLKRAQTK